MNIIQSQREISRTVNIAQSQKINSKCLLKWRYHICKIIVLRQSDTMQKSGPFWWFTSTNLSCLRACWCAHIIHNKTRQDVALLGSELSLEILSPSFLLLRTHITNTQFHLCLDQSYPSTSYCIFHYPNIVQNWQSLGNPSG